MREKFNRFMQGRYGQYGADALEKFLMYLIVACIILNLFLKTSVLVLIEWFLLFFYMYRLLSKNYNARYNENQKFLNATAKIRFRFEQEKKLAEERKYHHIYTCPKCKQKIRIPKGKGKIMVRCPKCHHEFQKRS